MTTTQAPFGSWKSPITADAIVAESIGLGAITVEGENVYWLEGRPTEGGRQVIVRRSKDAQVQDVNPPPFNARTRVHEYGGGGYLVHKGTVYFSNFSDQRLYAIEGDAAPKALTPELPLRYADGCFDERRNRIVMIREDHRTSDQEAVNTIVSVDVQSGGEGEVLVEGHDFFSNPRISPDGKKLCWLSWDHPNMPWDGTELWVADLDDAGKPQNPKKIAGHTEESIFQPEWSPEGTLYFVSDRSGWWNLYRLGGSEIEALNPMDAEFGLPLWQFGYSSYTFFSESEIFCTYTKDGLWYFGKLDTNTKQFQKIECPYTTLGVAHPYDKGFLFEGASPTEPLSLIYYDLETKSFDVWKRSTTLTIDPEFISRPKSIAFPSVENATAYGFFYAPSNPNYSAKDGEKPPLLVKSHGGPTSATTSRFNPSIQFWTSRGFAVLDVNYGGSTGYGRKYMKRLEGQWGVIDVEDCSAGAEYLVKEGLVDPQRLAIFGGSAGGLTTLCALAFKDTFKAGASHYGVADLEALVRDTHKFESRYPHRLVGPYPESEALYKERSPVNSPESLSCPVIFFQGLDDKIVPPNQPEMMVAALKKKGIPVEYVTFEGEQHGFRKAENIKAVLNRELQFYGKVFGFETHPN